jgi:hypothetical protein
MDLTYGPSHQRTSHQRTSGLTISRGAALALLRRANVRRSNPHFRPPAALLT